VNRCCKFFVFLLFFVIGGGLHSEPCRTTLLLKEKLYMYIYIYIYIYINIKAIVLFLATN